MRELKVTLKFTKECLGNVKDFDRHKDRWPWYKMPTTPDGSVRFESSWWRVNMSFAAEVLCRHHKAVEKIHFDLAVEGTPDTWYKRYLDNKRFIRHQAFGVGSTIVVRCIVPDDISDDDFKQLMNLVGRFRGISPYGPREFGFFTVESVQRSSGLVNETEDIQGRSVAAYQAGNGTGTADIDQPSEIHPTSSSHDEGRAGLCQR